MSKVIMRDMSKGPRMRYVVWEYTAGGMPLQDGSMGWFRSLARALKVHPDAVKARGCTKPDGTYVDVK